MAGPDAIFRALADPTRREIIKLLRRKARTSGEIAEHFPVAWATISRHLGVLKDAGLAASATAAYRLIEQGAVRVDGERVEARDTQLSVGSTYLLQAGKRGFARVTLKRS